MDQISLAGAGEAQSLGLLGDPALPIPFRPMLHLNVIPGSLKAMGERERGQVPGHISGAWPILLKLLEG